jgi:protein-L-isoaspartate(D-aspartate) O-methyltransferase
MRPATASRLIASLSAVIDDPRVLERIAAVPREQFVPPALRARAYENVALPIDCGQTISQPLVVGRMLALLELSGDELVLDVGTGSGYHAALLAGMTRHVISIERHEALSREAGAHLAALGIDNVELIVGDGAAGLPGRAPFDAINVAAAVGERVPEALIAQLAPHGRLVAPVTDDPAAPEKQWLVRVRRDDGEPWTERFEPVRFVPLVPGVEWEHPAAGP